MANYHAKLAAVYSYPEQMVFIDETSKDSRDAYRMHGWAAKGEKVVVKLPSGQHVQRSILAALGHNGFIGWETTSETFTRVDFHNAFINKILPKLNPWSLPRSIVVMDNAKIHMYPELCTAISSAGALLLFLPPYSPELNPIEVSFGLLKRWIQRNANIVFPLDPDGVLDIAMQTCHDPDDMISAEKVGLNLYRFCGYDAYGLNSDVFAHKEGLL